MEIKSKDLVQQLEKSGFTNKEAAVYVSVLELGGAFPSRIAEYSGLRRSTVYNVLVTLSVRGLINEIEKKKKIFYQIEKPDSISKHVDTQLKMAKDSVGIINSILPEITGLYNKNANTPKITYYTGGDGINSIYEDMVQVKKPYEMLAFTNARKFVDFTSVAITDKYFKAKEKIGITTRAIFPHTKEDMSALEKAYKNINKKYWPVFRTIEADKFPAATEITIYGFNKVSIINFEKNKLAGVIIEDSAIHDMMKAIFELSWNSRDLKS